MLGDGMHQPSWDKFPGRFKAFCRLPAYVFPNRRFKEGEISDLLTIIVLVQRRHDFSDQLVEFWGTWFQVFQLVEVFLHSLNNVERD